MPQSGGMDHEAALAKMSEGDGQLLLGFVEKVSTPQKTVRAKKP
jgi:hypothetical protein